MHGNFGSASESERESYSDDASEFSIGDVDAADCESDSVGSVTTLASQGTSDSRIFISWHEVDQDLLRDVYFSAREVVRIHPSYLSDLDQVRPAQV